MEVALDSPAGFSRPVRAVDRGPGDGALAAVQPPADLKSAWWVIDPDREAERARARSTCVEARFFGQAEREVASRENHHYLMLKALLGELDLIDAQSGFQFAMVPEEGGREGTIPVRPVALPVQVDERELAPPAILRLKAPTRRYRMVWIGRDRFAVQFGPAALPSAQNVPASPLNGLTPRARIPLEYLPIAPERE